LFRYIINKYLEGLAAGLAKDAIAQTLSEEALALNVLHISKEAFHKPGRKPTNVRAVVAGIREDLRKYYEDHPEEEIFIEIPPADHARKGLVEGYIPKITWRHPVLSESAKVRLREAITARNQRTKTSFARAISLLLSILKEPEHADHPEPKARLAEMYALRVMHGITPAHDLVKAQKLAQEAMAQAPHLWAAHIAIAAVHLCSYEWDRAASAFLEALRIDEQETHLQAWYFFYLVTQGQLDDAIEYYKRASRHEGISATLRRNLGFALILNGAYEAAEKELEQLVQDVRHFLLHVYLGMAYHANGKYEEALAQLRKARELPDSEYMSPGMWVLTLAQCGEREKAERELEDLLRRHEKADPHLACSHLAIAYVGLGNDEEAITWLERAFASNDPLVLLMNYWPMMRKLHGHPRFQEILEKMKYPKRLSQ
jgi:tetratricopeptide (TPR) repeat protein